MLGTGLYTASTGGDEKAPEAPAATKLDMGAGLRGDSLETTLRGDLKKILDGQTLLGDRVNAIEEGTVVQVVRAVGREGECQYVSIAVVAVDLTKKNINIKHK